jgi:hypothetical protein
MLVPAAAGRPGVVVDGAPSSGKVAGVLTGDELEHDVRADDLDGTGLQNSAEAVADPPVGLRRRFDQQALPLKVEIARTERLQPDAVGRLVDGQRKLGLHA